MKKLPVLLLLAAGLSASLVFAQAPVAPARPAVTEATPAEPVTTPSPLPLQPPDVAAPKMDPKTGQPQAGFLAAHERFLATAKEGKAKLLFLGDSITAGWGGAGKEIWSKSFSAYEPANFGIGGDRTQHLLWRITNGELDIIKPKVTVVMIGTNNVSSSPAGDIAKGVTKIVETVRTKLPETKILLLAIFPRGDRPTGTLGALNEKLKEVNATIAKLADAQHVHFLDIGPRFTQGKDVIDPAVMPDFLHLSPAGYQIWADAITLKLAELMK